MRCEGALEPSRSAELESTAPRAADVARTPVLHPDPAPSAQRTEGVRVLIVSPELAPISGRGMLAEITARLSVALRFRGHDVRVVMPFPSGTDSLDLPPGGPVRALNVPLLGDSEATAIFRCEGPVAIPVDLVSNDRYFPFGSEVPVDDDERFIFFCKVVAQLIATDPWNPDVVHCIGWHSAMLPDYLRSALGDAAPVSVLSLCDLERFSPDSRRGRQEMDSPQLTLEIASRGVVRADAVCLIDASPADVVVGDELPALLAPYLRSREIPVHRLRVTATPPPVAEFDPRMDPALHTAFGPDSISRRARNKQALQLMRGLPHDAGVPLIGMICRPGGARALRWMAAIFDRRTRPAMQLVATGAGSESEERTFARIENAHPHFFSFRRESPAVGAPASRAVFAGSDVFLAECHDDPALAICLRYGALPVVPTGNPANLPYPGFGFDPRNEGADVFALQVALAACEDTDPLDDLRRLAMSIDPAWAAVVEELEAVYATLLWGATPGHRRIPSEDSRRCHKLA